MLHVRTPRSEIGRLASPREAAEIARALSVTRRGQALLAAAGESDVEQAWIVARVAPGQDFAVEKSMRAAGLDAWIGIVQPDPVWRGGRRRQVGPKPVWPGYVFVRCAMNPRGWAGLFSLDGVVALLGTAAGPVAVDPVEIRRLRSMLASDRGLRDKALDTLLPGDGVIVCEGPFASFGGEVFEVDLERGRAGVEVAIFGRVVPVDLELAQIRKLG